MCDTIPVLQEVEEALALVHDHASMPKVICVAAHASLMLVEKYHSMNDECEVYRIAIAEFRNWYCGCYRLMLPNSDVSGQETKMVQRAQMGA